MQKKSFKTGILIATLCVPAFVFIFLKLFGENVFDLPYFFPKIADDGEVMIVKGDTVFNKAPNFVLTNQNNQQFNFNNKNNDIKVVSFFFSRCGTICPTTNQNLARVQELFKNNEIIKLISISIDPVYDTPDKLKAYAESYKAKAEKWQFLTGDKKYIYDLAIKGFKLPVADASEYDKSIKSIDETFIHSDKLLLVDNKGFFRGIYSSTDKFEIDRLIVEIKVLLKKK
jgi:protein SCO1